MKIIFGFLEGLSRDMQRVMDNASQLCFRYAQPVSIAKTDWLIRASPPINSFSETIDKNWAGRFQYFRGLPDSNAKSAVSLGIGPQFSVADKGAGWPKRPIFYALNLQFPGKSFRSRRSLSWRALSLSAL